MMNGQLTTKLIKYSKQTHVTEGFTKTSWKYAKNIFLTWKHVLFPVAHEFYQKLTTQRKQDSSSRSVASHIELYVTLHIKNSTKLNTVIWLVLPL